MTSLLNPKSTAKVVKHAVHDQSTHGNWARGGSAEEDYRGSHQPNSDYGAPAYDLTEIVAEDIYTHPEYYMSTTSESKEWFDESMAMIQAVRNKPEADVTIYRAVPRDVTTINPGDWVTPSREYARTHGEHNIWPEKYVILERTVKAKELMWPGDYLPEWGWFPDNKFAKHANHDQSTHGNWARGGTGKTKIERITEGELAEHNSPDYQRYRFPDDDRTYVIRVLGDPDSSFGQVFFEPWEAGAERLGLLSWWRGDEPEGPVVQVVNVHPEWQRRGIATEMLRMARQVRPEIRHSAALTEEGTAWAEVAKHYGPGPHPGTGTPQDIHAPGGGLNPAAADKVFEEALAPLIAEFGPPPSGFTYAAGVSPVAYKWFNEIYAKLNEDEALFAKFGSQLDTWWDTRRAVEGENERDLYIRLALGEISPEEATNLGLSEYNSEIRDLGELPAVVYHATTDASSVMESGLKARDELGQEKGLGLGGGTANTISFTDDEATAMAILRGMRERHAVLNDPATEIPRLIEEAKAGVGTDRPWWHSRMDTKWTSVAADKLSEGGVQGLLAGEATYVASLGQKTVDELRAYWSDSDHYRTKYDLDSIELIKPYVQLGDRAVFKAKYTPQGHAEAIGDFMDEYAAYRASSGGHLDPLFIFNDDYAFAQKDPSDFAVIKGKTKPGTRGYSLGSLSEWRTWTGEVLESYEVMS